jgi:hypothetical protein
VSRNYYNIFLLGGSWVWILVKTLDTLTTLQAEDTVHNCFSSYPSEFSIQNYHALSHFMLIIFTFDKARWLVSLVTWWTSYYYMSCSVMWKDGWIGEDVKGSCRGLFAWPV